MTHLRLFLLLTTIATLFGGCYLKDPLIGTWDFTHSDNQSTTNQFAYSPATYRAFITFTSDKQFLLVEHALYSSPIFDASESNTLTDSLSMGKTYFGIWKRNKNQIELTIKNQSNTRTIALNIQANDGKNMLVSFPNITTLDSEKEQISLYFKKTDYNDISQFKYNYAVTELNQWRQKETKSLSEKQIRAKIIQALEFSITYFKYNLEAKTGATNIYFSQPFPLDYYSNGVILQNIDQSPEWNALFTTKQEVEIAYSILLHGIKSVAKIPNKLKKKPMELNLFILEEMLKNIQHSK